MLRSEYMAPYIDNATAARLHREYYAQFVTPGMRALVLRVIGADAIATSCDSHFNDIALIRWDRLVPCLSGSVAKQLKGCGDYLTLAGAVCILKEAAQQIREKQTHVIP